MAACYMPKLSFCIYRILVASLPPRLTGVGAVAAAHFPNFYGVLWFSVSDLLSNLSVEKLSAENCRLLLIDPIFESHYMKLLSFWLDKLTEENRVNAKSDEIWREQNQQ